MSIGNLKDEGNKGNNFPYQLRSLQILGEILTAVQALPGQDYELRITPYKANTNGTGYSTGDFITRTDIINVPTGTIISTLWFNETTGLTITAPPIGNLNPYTPPSAVTVSNLPVSLGQSNMAGSLAVVLASNQSAIPVTQGTSPWVISAASLPLPTGAATETTLASLLTLVGFQARINTLGQKTMAASTPVVLASDQSVIPVTLPSGSQTASASIVTDSTGSPVAAGATEITFTTNSSFAGTILGVTRNPSTVYVLDATAGKTLGSILYTVTAGSMTIDKII